MCLEKISMLLTFALRTPYIFCRGAMIIDENNFSTQRYSSKDAWGRCGLDLYGSWIYNYLCNQCLSPLMFWVRISIRTRYTTLCDKVCQWLVTGLWFSPGTPVSSTNKTDLHDITEILLKVALNNIKTNKQIKWCMVSILQVPPLSSKVMQQYGSNKFSKFGHFQLRLLIIWYLTNHICYVYYS